MRLNRVGVIRLEPSDAWGARSSGCYAGIIPAHRPPVSKRHKAGPSARARAPTRRPSSDVANKLAVCVVHSLNGVLKFPCLDAKGIGSINLCKHVTFSGCRDVNMTKNRQIPCIFLVDQGSRDRFARDCLLSQRPYVFISMLGRCGEADQGRPRVAIRAVVSRGFPRLHNTASRGPQKFGAARAQHELRRIKRLCRAGRLRIVDYSAPYRDSLIHITVTARAAPRLLAGHGTLGALAKKRRRSRRGAARTLSRS